MPASLPIATLDAECHGSATRRVETFAAAVSELRAAQQVLDLVRADTRLHAVASAIVAQHQDRLFELTLACMLGCGGTLTHTTTVGEYLALSGPPRGICGQH